MRNYLVITPFSNEKKDEISIAKPARLCTIEVLSLEVVKNASNSNISEDKGEFATDKNLIERYASSGRTTNVTAISQIISYSVYNSGLPAEHDVVISLPYAKITG